MRRAPPAPQRAQPRPRAFSMVELLVALAMTAVVLTAVMGTLAVTYRQQRLQRVRAHLGREGAALAQVFSQELRVGGLGRPLSVDVALANAAPEHMPVAQKESIEFLADIPRPDANYSTFGVLHDRPADNNRIMWHTDNNGVCAPDATGTSCDTADSSNLFVGETGCNAATASAALDRTCAWGSKRLRGGDFFQIVGGNGTYLRVQAPASLTLAAATNGDGGSVYALPVDTTYRSFPASWPNNARGAAPVDIRGQGFVTTIDRVFYRRNSTARTIERNQCWGDLDVTSADWPARTVTTTATTLQPGGITIGPAARCTGWEVLARDVESLTFTYFNAGNSGISYANLQAVGNRTQVARVEFVVLLRRVVEGQPVVHEVVGSVRLRNI